jgi:hypothetical protein
MNIRCVLAVDKIADPNATAAVYWAGAFPYFSGRRCSDVLGKNDPHVARLPAIPRQRRPGHNKRDFTYTLNRYEPDVVLHAIDIANSVFVRNYQPVVVEVDGTKVALSVRMGSPWVGRCKVVDWLTAFALQREARRNVCD